MKIINWIKSHRIETIFILLIFLVGGFLRFYGVVDYMHFAGDEARDSFMVRSIVRDGDVQLLGPSISPGDQAFSLGPFFYYLLVPGYWLSGNSPTSGAVLTAILSFFSIGLLYFLSRKWFGVIAAITASFLYSVSWIVVYYGRWVWNPNLIPFFILFFIICLYYLVQGKEAHKKWWLLGVAILFAILTQLHGTALYILPPFLLFYFLIFRPKINWRYYLIALLLIIIFYTPLIIYDIKNDFSNSRGFIHLLNDRESNGQSFIISFQQTFDKFFIFYNETLSHEKATLLFIIIFASSLAYIFHQLNQSIVKKTKSPSIILLILWFFIPFVVFIFYQGFIPPHYYSIVFPISFIMVGALMEFFSKYKWLRMAVIIIPLVFGSILLYNSIIMLIDLHPGGSRQTTYQLTYHELDQIKDYVISDSQGQAYNFKSDFDMAYGLSFEYIFDNSGFKISYDEANIEYVAYYKIAGDFASKLKLEDIIDWRRFGNIMVIKKTSN